ncbi:MAG: hypothetical protein ACKO0Z_25215 [Betaproteobacteria bacterium]
MKSPLTIVRSPYWYYKGAVKEYVHEKHPTARFVEEIVLPAKGGGWTDSPGVLMYEDNPPAPYTNNWFAYFRTPDNPIDGEKGHWLITGLKSYDPVVEGLYHAASGTIGISRYGHDYFYMPSGHMVDGGRNYTRFGGSDLASVTVVKVNILTRQAKINGEWYDYVG